MHVTVPQEDQDDITGYYVSYTVSRYKQSDVRGSATIASPEQPIVVTTMPDKRGVCAVNVQAMKGDVRGRKSPTAHITVMGDYSEADPVIVTSPTMGTSRDSYTLRWEKTLEGRGFTDIIGYRFTLREQTEYGWPWNDVEGEEVDVYQDSQKYRFNNLKSGTGYDLEISALTIMKDAYIQKGLPTRFSFQTKA